MKLCHVVPAAVPEVAQTDAVMIRGPPVRVVSPGLVLRIKASSGFSVWLVIVVIQSIRHVMRRRARR